LKKGDLECTASRLDNNVMTVMASITISKPIRNQILYGLTSNFIKSKDYSLEYYVNLVKDGKYPWYNNGLISKNSINKLIKTVKKFKLLEPDGLDNTLELSTFFREPQNNPNKKGKGLATELLVKIIEVYKTQTKMNQVILYAKAVTKDGAKDYNNQNKLIIFYKNLGFQVMYLPYLTEDVAPIMIASFSDILNSPYAKNIDKTLSLNFIFK
jgi:hypothetical protein